MEFYFLVALSQCMLGLALFSEKLFSKKSSGYLPTNLIYSAGIAVSSLFVYSLMAGFNLTPDFEIISHAVIYGILYASSMTCLFIAYKRLNMVVYSVFGKSASIAVCIIGMVFWGDTVKFTTIAGIVLLFVSILLPLLAAGKTEGKKGSFANLLICIATMVIGTGASLVIKSFSSLESYTPARASAMYFYANIFTFIFLVGAVLVYTKQPDVDGSKTLLRRHADGFADSFLRVNPKLYILVPIVATVANIPSVINTLCVNNMDLSVYTVLSRAIELLVLFVISRFIFKEKYSRVDITSLIISGVAGLIICF